ncbi:MAG: signal transduction histidine kinase [Rhodospirillaceae bacterium]|nr:MAG: signal transduction histidine kinase [Rhodospirillaceae bacterium]
MERDVAVAVWSLRGTLCYANAMHAHLFGTRWGPSGEECLKKLFVPETSAFLRQTVLPGVRGGQPWEGDVAAIDGWKRRIRLFGRFDLLQAPIQSSRLLCTTLHDGGNRDAVLQQLRTAKEAAERANDEKRQLIALAGHDLRQPIQALQLFAVSLQRQTSTTYTMRPDVNHINTSSRILEDLVNGLFDLSRIESGMVVPAIADVPLRPLLNHIHEAFAAPATSLGLRLSIVPSCLTVRSDGIVLGHILRTLVGTSLRYTQRGGIVVGCRRRKGTALLQIWDSGPGIQPRPPRETLESDSPCTLPQDMELGLVISCDLAQRLGHALEIFSLPGHGTLFQLRLPLVSQETPQPVLLWSVA